MKAASELSQEVGRKPACEALQVPRATFYRHLDRSRHSRPEVGTTPPLSLSQAEKQDIIDTLHSRIFQDKGPYEVYATLLEEGRYHCPIRTIYRILKSEHGDVKEPRKGHQRTRYTKPEPNNTQISFLVKQDISHPDDVTIFDESGYRKKGG